MGFDQDRVDWALSATKSTGLQAALDHLEANQDKPMPEDWRTAGAADGAGSAGDDAQAAQAKVRTPLTQSIRCRECGKVFRDMDLAMYHADKSGHDDFEESAEEIKPLTEEEKKERLAERTSCADAVRAKMQEKRAKQATQDAEERRANEMIRRKAGQDANQARKELEQKGTCPAHAERLKDAERKRREKLEDAAAKARVKAQIEEDKRRRAEKAAREKALREGAPLPGAAPQGTAPTMPAAPKTSSAKEARLRVRAPGGQWMGVLPSEATLADLQAAVLSDGKGGDASALQFSTTFPRRTFTADEQAKTLAELGLVPNAALEASKAG